MKGMTRNALIFLLGFVVVLIVSAFLSPWLFTFLPFKFDRILRRLIMIGALLLVGWLIRVRRQNLLKMGLVWEPESPKFLGQGFLIGTGLVVLISLAQWALGARFWQVYHTDAGRWIGLFFKALAAGFTIGFIEEWFFRGFLFTTLKDLWNTKASIVVTNLVYALVHFFPKGKVFIGPHPTVADSFRVYSAAILVTKAQWLEVLPAMLGLWLFGVMLTFVMMRTGSLYRSIGVHAGAVFSLKLNRRFIPEIAPKLDIVSGSKNLYDGISGLIILVIAAIISGWWACRRKKQAAA